MSSVIAPPEGTVTFLFTDLVSSTRLWEEFPDAMRDALARHDALVQDAVAAHDGYLVKTTGDGAHAAFPTARAAIDAAIDAQLALAREAWGETGTAPGADGTAHRRVGAARRRLLRHAR